MYNVNGFTLSNAGYSYNDVPVIRDLDLELVPGKFYGIVGPNGCGKTTLLDLLTGNKCSNGGCIMYDSQPVDTYRRRDLARQVALVPQDYTIGFSFTVEEVVLMGRHPYINRFGSPSREDWRLVEKAMADIGITAFRERYVNELSGGEKQRVVVARALAQNTPVLLFDEATSSLDVKYTLQIFNVARSLVMEQQRTVIAVIHNLNLAAAYCDEVIFMKEGRVVSCGPTQKVMEPNTIHNVFGVEAKVGNDEFNNALQVSIKYWS